MKNIRSKARTRFKTLAEKWRPLNDPEKFMRELFEAQMITLRRIAARKKK